MKKFLILNFSLLITFLLAGCFERDLPLEGECILWETCEIVDNTGEIVEEDYTPVEEWTKAIKENPWDWANNEDVYPTAWLQTLDSATWVYPYASFFGSAFSSKDNASILSFEIYSEDREIKRFAIYDRDHQKWLFDCFDGWGGRYIEIDDSIDVDKVDVASCKEKYNEVITYLSVSVDIESEILDIPNDIPSLEELDDVVAVCHNKTPNCVIDCEDQNITRKSYIIPYKDWYIGYNYGWNGEWRGYHMTYKSLDNPCETIATTDEIFFWHAHYKYNKETFNYDEYPDNKLYINQWWWGGIPIDEVAKNLDCTAWEEFNPDTYNTCKEQVDKFMYNLILWNEQNDYFTKWMDKFKKDIDNGIFTNRNTRSDRRDECNFKYSWDSLMEKYWEDNRTLSDESRRKYQKIQNTRIHDCIIDGLF